MLRASFQLTTLKYKNMFYLAGVPDSFPAQNKESEEEHYFTRYILFTEASYKYINALIMV